MLEAIRARGTRFLVARHENEIGGNHRCRERVSRATDDEDPRWETKHPAYFRNIGLALEPKLLQSLRTRGRDRRDAPVFIQSFEDANLRALRRETRVRLVQLVNNEKQVTPDGLASIARYADGVGPHTRLVIPASPEATATTLVRDAHAAGLVVHVWTLRPEPGSLPPRYNGDPLAEVRELAALDVDGMFGDCPDLLTKGLGRR